MLAKQVDISITELENMTIGGLIDYAHTYAEHLDKGRKKDEIKVREATQEDIDRML